MISTASKLGGKVGFVQFVSSGAMNNMFLFQGLCVALCSLVGYGTKNNETKRVAFVTCVCLMTLGSVPFAIAVEKAELPESGDLYKFFRGASTMEREVDTSNTTSDTLALNNCGIDTCLVSGSKEVIASLFPGSSVVLEFDYGDILSKKTVKILVHDFNIKQNLVYDYSQYDYGIGIVEGDTIDGTQEEATTNWWKKSQFSDNANNYISSPWKISDVRKLPNNLRNYHFASNTAGKECGTRSNSGTMYSRQVIIPQERGVSFFFTDSDVIHQGLFEIVSGTTSVFKTLDEMKDGVTIEKGLTITLAEHDKVSPKQIKGFCYHKLSEYGFEKCYEYSYPALGNPSSQGPGHFQTSKMLDKSNENPSVNHYFGRSDWDRDMVFFRDGNCDSSEGQRMAEQMERLLVEGKVDEVVKLTTVDLERELKFSRGTEWVDLSDKNRKLLMKGNVELDSEILNNPDNQKGNFNRLMEIFGMDNEKKRKFVEGYGKSSRSFIAWIILAILAAITIAAVLMSGVKDNCCSLERFGYNNFDEIASYGRPMNESLSAYKSEVFWSGQKSSQGEPMSNYMILRETQEVKARFLIEAEEASVDINNDAVNLMKFEIQSCDCVKSGSSGSCNILYEVIGSGGNVKLVSENCKLNNPLVGMKTGQNLIKVGINSVGYQKSSVKICVSGSTFCSESKVNFVTSPDGGEDMLTSGTNFGAPFMTFQDMMSNGWFAFTFVMTCIVSASLGIVMLIALGYLIKDYVRPEFQGISMRSLSVAIVYSLCLVVIPANSLEIYGNVSITCDQLSQNGLPCSYLKWANNPPTPKYHLNYIIAKIDIQFLDAGRCINASFSNRLKYDENDLEKEVLGSTFDCTTKGNDTWVAYNAINGSMGFAVYRPTAADVSIFQRGQALNLPYSWFRATEDAHFFSMFTKYFWQKRTNTWWRVGATGILYEEPNMNPNLVTACVETRWDIYSSVCPSGGYNKTSASENLCYGCYGMAICGWSRNNGLSTEKNIICVNKAPDTLGYYNRTTNISMSIGDIGVFGSGVSDRSGMSEGCSSTSLTSQQFCDRSYIIRYAGGTLVTTAEVLGIQILSDGINIFGTRFELLWSVGTVDFGSISMGDVCSYLTIDESSTGPVNCVKSGSVYHCSIYCEKTAPFRPSDQVGRSKLAMRNYGGEKIGMLISNSKGLQKKIINELIQKNKKTARSSKGEPTMKDSKGMSTTNYKNIFITYDGVAMLMELGGPFQVNCYFGNEQMAFCNNSMGMGWLQGVPLKTLNRVDGDMMFVPEGTTNVHFVLDGTRCEGVLTDVEGGIYCDNTCCSTSFDDFKTGTFAFAGDRVVPKSKLAQSYIDKGLTRASSTDNTVYPQGVDYNYNSTCKRDSSVNDMWICLREYYPQVFWPVIGTIIAFFSLTVVFLLWRYGFRRCGKMTYNAVKTTGKKVVSTGIKAGRWVINKVDRANIQVKKRFSEKLISLCNGLLKDNDLNERDTVAIKDIRSTLEKKQLTWSKKLSGSEVKKIANEQRVSLLLLESYRMKIMEIARKQNDKKVLDECQKLSKPMVKAQEEIQKLKESEKRK